MRTLITGGAGFIGSHLAEVLLQREASVAVVDDLSTGSIDNIRDLKNRPGFSYVIDSVMNRSLMAELIDESDVIYHLATPVGVRFIVESPIRTIETNVKGTEIVLELAAKKRKIVVITSTSEVYGKANEVPFREDGDLVLGPTSRGRWSYACSKALDEFLAIAYWRERHCPTLIGRCFNTVGPRQTGHYGMVVPRFVKQALHDEALTVYGDGQQSRCFTHVSDAVRAMMALMDADHTVGEVYNVGSEQEICIADLAERVRVLTDSESEIAFTPYEQVYGENFEDMPRRVPSLEKIRRAVGYEPQVDLDETLQSVIDYERSVEPQLV